MNGLFQVFQIPELKKRLLFTISMLAVYRFGVFVSTPGVNVAAIRRMFDENANTLFGLINLFSGGAIEQFSIFTLGISPYITVSIIIQLLSPSIPFLENLKKEGEAGRRIITRYTRQGTILLALFQSFMIARALENRGLATTPGLSFEIITMLTLTAGTSFIMWLGEQITERGLGNGISVIIFAGIAARMPQVFAATVELARTGEISPFAVLFLIIFSLLTIYAIIFVERSHRKIPIQYPRRMVGKRMTQAQTQYMPLKVNMTGVIPPIFASAILMLPATIMTVVPGISVNLAQYFSPGGWGYEALYVALIILFSYFYTAVVFNPVEVADNLKKNGGFIPTVRPGQQTADYLYGVLTRLTLWGALYISIVCVVPQMVYFNMGASAFAHVFSGTAVLIVVGVTLDTAAQIESMLVARNYESFMSRSSKVRGGLGSMNYTRSRLLRR
jgi:preprotein translocase subunit SecY